MNKGINKPAREKEDIVKFVHGLNKGMINEDEEPEYFDLMEIKKILDRPENKEDLNSDKN